MTAEEHLRADVSAIIANYVFQLAIAKSEIDRLRVENAALKESKDGAVAPARVSE